MGLRDQQSALRWVRENVDSFYGDAQRVTLSGQSAGGMAAVAHMASPGAQGLFDQVCTSWHIYDQYGIPSVYISRGKI